MVLPTCALCVSFGKFQTLGVRDARLALGPPPHASLPADLVLGGAVEQMLIWELLTGDDVGHHSPLYLFRMQ